MGCHSNFKLIGGNKKNQTNNYARIFYGVFPPELRINGAVFEIIILLFRNYIPSSLLTTEQLYVITGFNCNKMD